MASYVVYSKFRDQNNLEEQNHHRRHLRMVIKK